MPAKPSTAALVISRPNSGKEDIRLDYSALRKAALMLRAVNHPLRKQMISMMTEKKKLTVTEIHTKLKLEQSVASQHLAILRKAGVTHTLREGKFIFYSINKNRMDEITTLVDELAKN